MELRRVQALLDADPLTDDQRCNARTQVSNASVGHSKLLLDLHPAVVQLQHVFLRLQQYLGYFPLLFGGQSAVLCSISSCSDHDRRKRTPLTCFDSTAEAHCAGGCTAAAVQVMQLHGAVMHASHRKVCINDVNVPTSLLAARLMGQDSRC
jgi:hypothetical protein